MKSRAPRSTRTRSRACTFLKPGALAQIKNSKIAAKSKANYARASISSSIAKTVSGFSTTGATLNLSLDMDQIPWFLGSFKTRYQPPRCLVRKKLVAAMPFLPNLDL